MTKLEFAAKHGMIVRPVTDEDRAVARTDYQRDADFILAYKGVEFFSKRATLSDMKYMIQSVNKRKLEKAG